MDRNRLMMAGAGLAAVVVIIVGFLMGVQPQLQSASAAQASETTVSTQNATLAADIVSLRSQFSKLDSLKTQLGLLSASVPSDVDAGSFITEINGIASSTGATVTGITTGNAVAYVAPVSTAATPAASTSTASSSASPSASATATTAPAPTASTPVAPTVTTDPQITAANFSDVSVSIAITATNEQALSFLQELRDGQRLYLVTGISKASAGAAAASAGPSVTSPTWTITGLIYALDTKTAPAAASTTTGN